MKRIFAVLTLLFIALSPLSCGAGKEEAPAPKELKSDTEKLGYAIGLELGTSLKSIREEVDLGMITQGLTDGFNGAPPLMPPEKAAEVKTQFLVKMQEKKTQEIKELAEKNKQQGADFLAKNKTKKDVVTTASGLQYTVLQEGTGAQPKNTDNVKVHYRGSLLDGTEFDSSYKRNEPAVFPVEGLIPGWGEALQLMKVGSKYRFFIPAELAYGEQGAGGAIGPNSTLDFEVELLGIEKPAEPQAPGAPQGAPATGK